MCSFNVKLFDVVIQIDANFIESRTFFEKFLTEETCEVMIQVDFSEIQAVHEKIKSFDLRMCERAILKYKIDKIAVDYNAFPIHASALMYKNNAYIFTALSGVGKSTHAKLWREAFGKDVIMINDDRPYLKVTDKGVFAYSHPQAGKHNIYTNTMCKVLMIGKIVRDNSNFVKEMSKPEFFPFFVQQTFTMDDYKTTKKIIGLIKKALTYVQVCEVHCNMDPDAAYNIYKQVNKIQM